jgi:hypothetical protein
MPVWSRSRREKWRVPSAGLGSGRLSPRSVVLTIILMDNRRPPFWIMANFWNRILQLELLLATGASEDATSSRALKPPSWSRRPKRACLASAQWILGSELLCSNPECRPVTALKRSAPRRNRTIGTGVVYARSGFHLRGRREQRSTLRLALSRPSWNHFLGPLILEPLDRPALPEDQVPPEKDPSLPVASHSHSMRAPTGRLLNRSSGSEPSRSGGIFQVIFILFRGLAVRNFVLIPPGGYRRDRVAAAAPSNPLRSSTARPGRSGRPRPRRSERRSQTRGRPLAE